MKTAVLAMVISLSCVANLRGQSGGHDLPRGFQSIAGVTLNRDSAATIRATWGATRQQHVGTGHGAYIRWCYVPAAESSRALLELMSDASDVGTAGHVLNVIRMRAAAPHQDREGCASLRASAALSTPAGLRLGLSAAQIEQLLGRPTRAVADSLIYYFVAKEFLRTDTPEYEVWNTPEYREACFDAGPPYANVGATVIILLRDERAAELRIERNDRLCE